MAVIETVGVMIIVLLAGITIVMFVVVIVATILVAAAVHTDKPYKTESGERRETLSYPAPGIWTHMARAVCGVYTRGLRRSPGLTPVPRKSVPGRDTASDRHDEAA
jgi:hypothetical protein